MSKLNRKERAGKRRELANMVRLVSEHFKIPPGGLLTDHCIVCYAGFISEKPYHAMRLCSGCARRAGAAWFEAHAGAKSSELDPEGAKADMEMEAAKNEGRYRKKQISGALRIRVFERDKYRCVSCGTHESLHVDHIHPERLGGTLQFENLQTLCARCNCKKGWRSSQRKATA